MRTVKKRSQLQEKSVAKSMGAKTVVASGALWSAKADVRSDKFLMECKTTEKTYYAITTKVWEKICEEADRDGMRIPLLFVDLEDRDRYVVFNPKDFEKQLSTYEIVPHVHGGFKSFKFSGYSEDMQLPLLFSLNAVKMKYKKERHILMVMKCKEFQSMFEEELSC